MQAAYQDLSAPAPDLYTAAPDPFFEPAASKTPIAVVPVSEVLPQYPAAAAAPPAAAAAPAPAAAMSSFAPVPTAAPAFAAPVKGASPDHAMPQNFFTAVNAQLLSAYVPGGSLVSTAGRPTDDDGFPLVAPLPPDAGVVQKVGYYYACAKNFKDRKVAHLRPWRDFANKDEFSIPGKLEALSRVSDNLSYFNSNYVALVAAMSLYILITNLSFMIGMLVCAATYYFIRMKQAANENIFLHTYEFTPTQAFVGLGIGGLLTFYLTGGSSTVFWLVTCAAVVVLGHAVTRRPMQRLAEPANTQISFA